MKQIPSIWDETLVLPGSKIGELAALARRKGSNWFIGVINGSGNVKKYEIDLAFLGDGQFKATFVRDGIDSPTAMKVEKTAVEKDGKMSVEMAPGGGFVAWLTR